MNKAALAGQHTLHTVLVEEATKKIWASERFFLVEGIAKGTLLLPDSILPGEYRLFAFTNSRLTHPSQPAFQQSITIRNSESKTFQLSFQPSPVSSAPDDSVRFKYKVLTDYGGLASKGEFSYVLLADGKKLQSAKKEIDAFGEVSFSLLKQHAWNKKLKLVATISRGAEKQDFQAAVPLFEDVAFVRHYPESGHLVFNHPARIALEIKNGLGVPIAIKGQLLEDNIPLTSFTTDQYGNAVLPLTPLPGKSYAIQLEEGYKHVVCDSFRIDQEGFTLRIDKPVLTDSLFQVEILAPDTGLCHILVHDYRNTFFSAKLRLNKKRSILSLPAANIPEGVATITLFDAAGNPRAERAVYVPQHSPVNVTLAIDTSSAASSRLSSFGKRQPLFVTVTTTNALGQPVKSRFSLACVLSSRLDSTRMPDIVRFQNFDRFLPAATAMPGSQYLADAANIEMLLLTKFWTKYKWNEIKSVALPEMQESFCDAGDLYIQHAPPAPDMRSTVFWTYLQETNEDGKAIITFPTNDLAGRFVCILQGISDESAISAKAYFNVPE